MLKDYDQIENPCDYIFNLLAYKLWIIQCELSSILRFEIKKLIFLVCD
jgi:hypothetical protein